jgi:hypothetical protein
MALDYVGIALSRLAGQFANSPKLQAMLAAIVGPLAGLEDTADSIREGRWIDTAIGAQLDGCGHIAGEARKGRTDEEYRAAIKFRVFVNVSEGTPVDMISGLKYLTNPTDTQYLEMYPASVILFTNGLDVDSSIVDSIREISPAGISDIPVAVSYAGKPFRFGRQSQPGELFVNSGADYLTANGSDIQVGQFAAAQTGSRFGGVVAAELGVTGGYLDVLGGTLAVYHPNALKTIGHDNLTGVFE